MNTELETALRVFITAAQDEDKAYSIAREKGVARKAAEFALYQLMYNIGKKSIVCKLDDGTVLHLLAEEVDDSYYIRRSTYRNTDIMPLSGIGGDK